MTIQEKLQADLDAAKQEIAAAQAKADSIASQLNNIPGEVAGIAHTEWDKIVAWFKAL